MQMVKFDTLSEAIDARGWSILSKSIIRHQELFVLTSSSLQQHGKVWAPGIYQAKIAIKFLALKGVIVASKLA